MTAQSVTRPAVQRRKTGLGLTLRKYWPLYVMLIPGLAYYVIFRYGPMYGLVIAFKNFNVFDGILGSPWAGFKHFESLFRNPQFTRILTNTVVISLLKLICGMPPAIILALMLNEVRNQWYKRFVQTASYLPHFLSWVMIYGILFAFLAPGTGLINQWIKDFGGTAIAFMTDKQWFVPVLVLSEIWKDVGWAAVLYLAGLAGINPELYEAATVDGAGKWKQVWHISLPSILPVIMLVLILRMGAILNAGFEQVYILYSPNVYAVSDIIDTWVFRNGIEQMKFPIATAAGLFKSVIGFGLVLISNKLSKKYSESGLW